MKPTTEQAESEERSPRDSAPYTPKRRIYRWLLAFAVLSMLALGILACVPVFLPGTPIAGRVMFAMGGLCLFLIAAIFWKRRNDGPDPPSGGGPSDEPNWAMLSAAAQVRRPI